MPDAPATPTPDLSTEPLVVVVRRALEIAQAVYPIPRWLVWLAAVLIAAVIVAIGRIDVGELFRRWQENTRQGPAPESPPMPMGEGGMTLNQKPMEPQP